MAEKSKPLVLILRILGLLAIIVASVVWARESGFADNFTVEKLRQAMISAGFLGGIAFLGAFVVGLIIQIPGLVFVAASILAYGKLLGFVISIIGSFIALTIYFWFVRLVGGQPLTQVRWKWARKLLTQLEEKPFRTIIVLRILLWMSPPVNSVLAFSGINYRQYIVGSLVGLLVPILTLVFVGDEILRTIS